MTRSEKILRLLQTAPIKREEFPFEDVSPWKHTFEKLYFNTEKGIEVITKIPKDTDFYRSASENARYEAGEAHPGAEDNFIFDEDNIEYVFQLYMIYLEKIN